MTKLNEIADEIERQSKFNYVDELWTAWREARESALKRITNYLFVLNTGALLASLTYLASKEVNGCIHIAIYLFSAGILCSVLHATIDYYISESSFSSYQKDVEETYSSKMDWEEFLERNDKRWPNDWYMHLLGWLGGLLFFIGLGIGVFSI